MPYAIQKLQAAGYKLVTLAECLGQAPYQSIGTPGTPDVSISSLFSTQVAHNPALPGFMDLLNSFPYLSPTTSFITSNCFPSDPFLDLPITSCLPWTKRTYCVHLVLLDNFRLLLITLCLPPNTSIHNIERHRGSQGWMWFDATELGPRRQPTKCRPRSCHFFPGMRTCLIWRTRLISRCFYAWNANRFNPFCCRLRA